jgi:hypothetical protein
MRLRIADCGLRNDTGNFGDLFSPEKEGAERDDFDFLIFFLQKKIKKSKSSLSKGFF